MALSTQTRIALPKLPKRETGGVPRTQAERLWLIAGGLVAFVMVLIGYFFFISPERSSTSDVKGQVAAAQQQNAVLQARIDALREQSKNLATYEAELATERLALPATSGVPDFLRTMQALSNATQTDVTSLSVGQPAAVTAPVGTQPTAAASTSAAATTPTSAGTAAASAPATAGVYSLSITATVSGSTSSLIKFLDQLQGVQPRAVLITQLTEAAAVRTGQPGQTGGQASLQLTMSAFVAPAASAAAAPSPSPSSTTH